jgi:hypothetical protein
MARVDSLQEQRAALMHEVQRVQRGMAEQEERMKQVCLRGSQGNGMLGAAAGDGVHSGTTEAGSACRGCVAGQYMQQAQGFRGVGPTMGRATLPSEAGEQVGQCRSLGVWLRRHACWLVWLAGRRGRGRKGGAACWLVKAGC